jgi:hypothetical protein
MKANGSHATILAQLKAAVTSRGFVVYSAYPTFPETVDSLFFGLHLTEEKGGI